MSDEGVTVAEGCGKVALWSRSGIAGTDLIFERTTERLVGVLQYSDIRFGPCLANEYLYGEGLWSEESLLAQPRDVCGAISRCTFCGEPTATEPSCF